MIVAVVSSAVVAGLLGLLGPEVLARVPEPEVELENDPEQGAGDPTADPEPPKRFYVDLAAARGLRWWLAGASAVLAGVAASQLDPRALAIVWTFLVPVGLLLAYVDWHTRLLPTRIVAPAFVVTLVLSVVAALVAQDVHVLLRAVVTAVVVFAFFFASWFVYPRGIGYGDVRLSGVLGLALGPLGWQVTVGSLWVGFALGAVLGLVLAAVRRASLRSYAFGPYLVAGAVLGALLGPSVMGPA